MFIEIEAADNLLPESTNMVNVKELINHMGEELGEVKEAFEKFSADPTGKNREHLAEEMADLMYMAFTGLTGLERMPDSPRRLVKASIRKVFLKDYVRGYHSNSETI